MRLCDEAPVEFWSDVEEHFRRWPPVCVINQWGFGHMTSAIYNVNRGKNQRSFAPADFFPALKPEGVPGDEAEHPLEVLADSQRADAFARWRQEQGR